jgi:short-subunit dehydrogenase
MDIRGRRVLVTGASRGIGEAVAREFAKQGARVALAARSAEPLEKLAAELGGTAHPIDLGDPAAVNGFIGRVEDDGGPVDVLVNNAGVESTKSIVDTSSDELAFITQVNYLAAAELTRQVLPLMLERGGGHVVNVSSMAGCAVYPGLTTYSSTKAALTHFTAGLRADLKGLPIGTTVVELGPIPTDMLSHVDDYEPTSRSFRRFYRLHLLVDVSKETVAAEVVEAVAKDRRHVRIPKRAALFPMLSEAPRRTV